MNGDEQGVERCKEMRNCSHVSSPTRRQGQLQCGWEKGEIIWYHQAVAVELSYRAIPFIVPQHPCPPSLTSIGG